jgi:putative flippase GtrA
MSPGTATRFVITGVANTAVGFTTIFVCAELLGWSPYLANAAGYAVGLAFGFVLNRSWTFGDRRHATVTAPRYVIAFGVSYGANLAMLAAGLRLLSLPPILAQAAALATYSLIFYLLCRYFVFESGAG